MNEELSWMVEFSAFVVMLGLSLVIGLYYGCVEGKQNTINEYLLGGKHMSVFPITMSLIASHISGVTLLGVPSEIYTNGTQFLIVGAINVVVIAIIIFIYLPVFYDLQLKSVYEYLELRFDSNIRGLCSVIFAISMILKLPVVIYLPALAFNQVIGINVHALTTIICVVCIFYTTIGGLKAVVWTDSIQSIFTALSIMLVIILGYIQTDGISDIIRVNQDGDRIEFFKMNPDPFLRHTFWTVSIGTTITWVNGLGIDPGAVQRFVALPSYNKAQKALIYFVVGVCVVQILTGSVGMLIYAKYKDCDPSLANYIDNDRSLLPFYVMDVAARLPGLTGLFVSGIVSAALSTMSAQLNTVSGTIYEDFVVNILGIQVSEFTASIIMKCTVIIVGTVGVVLVLVVERLKGILQMSISLYNVTCGATISAFTLGICFPKANSRGVMCGVLVSLGVMAWIVTGAQLAIYNNEMKFIEKKVSITGCPANTTFKNRTDYSGLYRMNEDLYVSPNVWKIYTISYMHYSTVGTVIGIAVGMAVSLLFPTDQKIDPKLLTPFVRHLKYPEYVAKTNANEPRTAEEYAPVAQQDTKL